MDNTFAKEIIRERFHGYILSKKNIQIEECRDIYYKKANLDDSDIDKAEMILQQYIKKNNTKIYKKLSRYKRQYIGIYSQGKKIVYINFFIPLDDGDKDKWREELYITLDGGDNFFSIKVNIDDKFCFDFEINGES